MNNLSGAARRMTRNLDQFSVICVFGSVVGCVVLPFMIQSVESFIITFLLLCLTAKPLRGKLFPTGNQAQQESERRRSKDKDDNKKSKKAVTKKKPVQVVGSSEQMQRVREEDLLKQEQQRLEDRERRLEEKREKKARKKEERLQRKEEEKREKEKEDQLRRERQEARMQKKKEEKERKQKTASFDIPTHENIQSIVNGMKPLRRERKHSTSSSASAGSVSVHCTPPRFLQQSSSRHGTTSRTHAAPFRASSDPELSVTARTSPTLSGKHWQAISTPHTQPTPVSRASSNWYTDIANRAFPSLPVVTASAVGSQPLFYPQLQGSYVGVYPTTTSFQQSMSTQNSTCWSVPPTMCVRNHDPSHVGEPLQYYVPQAAWLPVGGSNQMQGESIRNFSPAPGAGAGTGTGIGNGNAQQPNRFTGGQLSDNRSSTTIFNGSLFTSGFGTRNTGGVDHGNSSNCYSLFSSGSGNNTTPFSSVGGLLNLDTSVDHMQYQAVSTGSPLSINSDLSDGQNSLEAEPCGEGFQSSHHCVVESIGSSLPGQSGNGGNQPSCEWPNI